MDESTIELLKQELEYEKEKSRRLQVERDYLQKESADLKRRLQRQAIHASIVPVAIGEYDAAIEQVQKQRDDMAELHTTLLDNTTAVVEAQEERTLNKYNEEIQLFKQEYGKYGTPITVLFLQDIYQHVEESSRTQVKRITALIKKQSISTGNDFMIRALWMAHLNGQRELTIHAYRRFREIALNPYIICAEILEELRLYRKTVYETVSRLNPDWITRNISNRLGENSHALLCQAITHAYLCEADTLNQEEYAARIGETYDNFRKWIGYYKKVKEHARNAPEDVKKLFQNGGS